ncbi:MAG: hypothetical protein N2053_04290, partial [Chitinispirillaceae bacterium]|nr:hypothetical protein [Chitinispirillaceae bacterium]
MKKKTFLLLILGIESLFFFPLPVLSFSIINPTAQTGLLNSYSAKTMGFSRLRFSLCGNFSYDPNFILEVPQKELPTRAGKPFVIMYDFYPAMGAGITDFLDFSIVQPVFFDIIEGIVPTGGVGDAEIVLKTRIPGNPNRIIEGALLTEFTFSSGSRNSGFFPRHGYYFAEPKESTEGTPIDTVYPYNANKPMWTLLLLSTANIKRFFLHLNLGGSIKIGSNNVYE